MGQLSNLYVSQSYQGLIKLANSATGVTSTLQYTQDGLGNNLPIQLSNTQVNITGTFTVNGQPVQANVDTGSLVTTSSFNAYTSSTNLHLSALDVETGSLQSQINGLATTSSVTSLSQSIAVTDLGQNNRLSSLENFTASIDTGYVSEAEFGTYTSSMNNYTTSINSQISSLQVATGSLQSQINGKLDSSSFNSYTSSNDSKVNSLISKTGSYATTGSNIFNGNQVITGSVNMTGTISATSASFIYLQTIYETSSVIFSSGSNILGDASNDVQTLNGTVNIPLGPLNAPSITGSLFGSASYANQSLSSSFAQNAISSSYSEYSNQSNSVTKLVKNNTASTLLKGRAVYITGATGDNANVIYADYSNEETSSDTIGLLMQDIPAGGTGYVIFNGTLVGVNTSGYTAGDSIYLYTNGQWTNVKPQAPNQIVVLGKILRVQQNNGSVDVTINNGWELDELHNVLITNPQQGDLLSYVSGSYGMWYNKTNSQLGLAITGSNNFVGNQTITGSLNVTAGITGSLQGNASTATSASFATNATSASQAQNSVSSSYATQAFNAVSASWSPNQNPFPYFGEAVISGSLIVTGSVTSTIGFTGSLQGTASYATQALSASWAPSVTINTGSFATTGSNTFNGNQIINGSLNVNTDTITVTSPNPGLTLQTNTNGSGSQYNITFAKVDNVTDPTNVFSAIALLDDNNAQGIGISYNSYTPYYTGSTAMIYGGGNNNDGSDAAIAFQTNGTMDVWKQSNFHKSLILTGSLNVSSSVNNTIVGNTYVTGYTSLYRDVNVGHALDVNGDTNLTRLQFNKSPFFTGTTDNLAALRYNNLTDFSISNYSNSQFPSGTYINMISNTGSNYAQIQILPKWNNIDNQGVTISNYNGTTDLYVNTTNSSFVGRVNITGSLGVTAGITGSLQGTASYATQALSASYAPVNLPAGLVSGSSQIIYSGITGIPSGIISSSAQVSFTGITNVPAGLVSGSSQIVYSGLTGIPSGLVSGSSQITYSGLTGIPSGIISGSGQISGLGYAITGSNTFNGNQIITGSLYSSGQLYSNESSGNEGGQLNLALAQSGNTLTGSVSIDVYQNRVRIFEAGGTNRGGYFDLSTLAAGVATNLAAGGSSFPYTGSAIITGSLSVTGSVNGNVNALSISTNTASLDLNNGNFFTLQLVSGSATHILPSNIKPGQTINILLSTTGSATVSFPTTVKQISGSLYVPTTTTSKDIITLVSFDTTNLYLVTVKNLI